MSPGVVARAVGVGVVDGGGGVVLVLVRAWTPPPSHLGMIGMGETWR